MSGVSRVLFVSGSGGSNTLRYRVRLAEEALRAGGARTAAVHFTDPLARRWAERADVLWLYRTPATRRVLSLVMHARTRLGIPVVFDTDDLVFRPEHLAAIPFLGQLSPSDRALFEADVVRRGQVVPFVDRASASTGPVADELRALTDATVDVLPNGIGRVGLEIATRVRPRTPDGTVRLGYFSGSATHDADWAEVEPAVTEILRGDPRTRLWLVGPLRPGGVLDEFGDRVVRRAAVPWQALPALLAEVDINLAPLESSTFTEGKSALKWLESALVGVPTVATATRPFRDAVDDGSTGLLVAPGADWRDPLARLVDDQPLRRELARAAREAALAELHPDRQAQRYGEYVHAAVSGPRAGVDLDALGVSIRSAVTVRTLGLDLEPYPFPPELEERAIEPPPVARALPPVRSSVRSGLRSVRDAVRAGRRTASAARRRLRAP